MSAQSEAAEGFTAGKGTVMMLSIMPTDARSRVLGRAYGIHFGLGENPLADEREEYAANMVANSAKDIRDGFMRRQEQCRSARRLASVVYEPEPEAEGTPQRKRKAFTKPTVDEVRAYCSERRNTVDAQSFVDFYESKGWRVGSVGMKDWRAAVRTWERNRNGKGDRFGAGGYRKVPNTFSFRRGSEAQRGDAALL